MGFLCCFSLHLGWHFGNPYGTGRVGLAAALGDWTLRCWQHHHCRRSDPEGVAGERLDMAWYGIAPSSVGCIYHINIINPPMDIPWLTYFLQVIPFYILVGGFKHDFYFPFHIWDVILPIDELHDVSRWLNSPTRINMFDICWSHGAWGLYTTEVVWMKPPPVPNFSSFYWAQK